MAGSNFVDSDDYFNFFQERLFFKLKYMHENLRYLDNFKKVKVKKGVNMYMLSAQKIFTHTYRHSIIYYRISKNI